MRGLFLVLAIYAGSATLHAAGRIPETPFTTYTFPASECRVIRHEGSRILVPAFAFYLDGKRYDGEVRLDYRQFTDQLDILINHIPRAYSENDRQHTLESAGMFELYAYGNGRLLSFAPGKKITVQLATRFDMQGGETYILDKSEKQWKKETPFASDPASNSVLPDNSAALWGNDTWKNADPWLNGDYFLVNDSNVGYKQVLVRDKAFKTIQVDKMDMYNCDRILNEKTIPIVANFKLEGYAQQLKSEIYVVYKKRNAVMTYYPEQFATSFKLLPDEPFTIFSYAQDGKIAVLDDQFLQSFQVQANAGKQVVFPMKVFADLPQTKAQLAAITGL